MTITCTPKQPSGVAQYPDFVSGPNTYLPMLLHLLWPPLIDFCTSLLGMISEHFAAVFCGDETCLLRYAGDDQACVRQKVRLPPPAARLPSCLALVRLIAVLSSNSIIIYAWLRMAFLRDVEELSGEGLVRISAPPWFYTRLQTELLTGVHYRTCVSHTFAFTTGGVV